MERTSWMLLDNKVRQGTRTLVGKGRLVDVISHRSQILGICEPTRAEIELMEVVAQFLVTFEMMTVFACLLPCLLAWAPLMCDVPQCSEGKYLRR